MIMIETKLVSMEFMVCLFYKHFCAQFRIHVRKLCPALEKEGSNTDRFDCDYQWEYQELRKRIQNQWLQILTEHYDKTSLIVRFIAYPQKYIETVSPSKSPHQVHPSHSMVYLFTSGLKILVWDRLNAYIDYRLIDTRADSAVCVRNMAKTSDILDDDSMIFFRLQGDVWKTYSNGKWVACRKK